MRSRIVASLFVSIAVVAGFCLHSASDNAVAQTKNIEGNSNNTVQKVIAPFIAKHCVECHGPKKKNAGLALHIYTDEKSMLKDRRKWHEVMRMLTNGEMPPANKKVRPDLKDTEAVLKAISDVSSVWAGTAAAMPQKAKLPSRASPPSIVARTPCPGTSATPSKGVRSWASSARAPARG